MDDGSFEEIGALVTHRTTDFGMQKELYYGDGVITGYGTINGRLTYVSLRTLPFWWALSETHAKSVSYGYGGQNGSTMIGLNDSGGARIQEGVRSLGGYADIFYRNVQASGVFRKFLPLWAPTALVERYIRPMTDFTI
jgi:propionyl-CoA carboxylase beta chain